MSNIKIVNFNNKNKLPELDIQQDNSDYQKAKANIIAAQSIKVSKVTSGTGLPIIVCESGHLHEHANDYIITRMNHPQFFIKITSDSGRKTFRSITKVSAHNEADHLRNWLNTCALNGISYLEVDIEFLKGVLCNYRDEDDDDNEALSEESISKYINTWRLFYNYLDLIDVEHKMNFPAKIRQERQKSEAEDRSDFINHTKTKKQRRTGTYYNDPLINNKRKIKISNYNSQVLTETQVAKLIFELNKVDRVYAVMAHVQLDTLLRISELINYFPADSGNTLNKKWLNAAEMRLARKAEQPFKFIGKGQIHREINVDIQTMQMISDKYITAKRIGSDKTLYSERLSLFKNKHLKTKWAKKAGYTEESTVMWLTEEGHPVSKAMYRSAFSKALKVLRASDGEQPPAIESNIYVRPQALRHTGATLRLLKFSELKGIEICVANIDDIHTFLKNLLGHSDFETTEIYIETVRKIKVGGLARKTVLSQRELWKEVAESNPILKKGIEVTLSEESLS